jgi:ABC-type uncharacterized transport system ATPase subunit
MVDGAVHDRTAPTVRLRGITKWYPGSKANTDVDLDLRPGSVHGLLGENGAGKSTLVKVLFGLVHPDAGTIEIDGVERVWKSPGEALAAGIGMVQQHFSLISDFTVAENLVLGAEPRRRGLLDRRRAVADVQQLADSYGFRLDANRRVRDLAVGARQRVEILKALHRGAQILVLDEPTAALAPPEVDELFRVLDRLRSEGCTIVLITHKLNEVTAMCDEVTVLRDGRVVVHRDIADEERVPGEARARFERDMAMAMVGRELEAPLPRARSVGAPALSLEALTAPSIGPLDLVVSAGEIVGVAGVEGNGQTELVELILGVRRATSGAVCLAGRDVTRRSVAHRLASGLAHIAEDRHAAAVASAMSVVDNCVLGFHDERPFTAGPLWMSRSEMHGFAADVIDRYSVRTPGIGATMAQLSGGNQQKLVVGREVSRRPAVMVAAQPTRGLDMAATAFVHEELARLRAEGCGVLLVSLDLAEVLSVSDRVVVMRGGRIVGEGRSDDLDIAELGAWMTGAAR